MKKITIRRADYRRKRRHFFEKEHAVHDEVEQKAAVIEQETSQPLQEEAVINDTQVHEPVEARKEHVGSWMWLLLPLGLLLGASLMVLYQMLFMKQHDDHEEKSAVETTEQAVHTAKNDVVSVINLQKATDMLASTDSTADPEEVGVGSGVIYKLTKQKALIVTNYHVIKDAQTIEVTTAQNDKLIAKVIGSDIWTDLAVLSVDRHHIDSKIHFADSENIDVGSTAIAIGSPLGQTFAGSVSKGVISGLHRSVPVDIDGDGSYDFDSNVIQTDAAINPGNSGGALINLKGELLGINAMKISLPNVEGLSFAIPANDVKEIVKQLETKGKIKRPVLGVDVEDLNNLALEAVRKQINLPDDINSGVIITRLDPAGPAAAAGLMTKDVITKLDGKAVSSLVEFRNILYYDNKAGDTLAVTYIRQGKEKSINVKLK